MTAGEWDTSEALGDLLRSVADADPSRFLLFNAACAARVAEVMPDDGARALVGLTERRAYGAVSDREWVETLTAALDPYLGNEAARDRAGGATFGVLMNLYRPEPDAALRVAESVVGARAYLAYAGGYPVDVGPEEWVSRAAAAEVTAVCRLFRCVFANPLRPPASIEPAWLTSEVVALARGVAADRVFDRLPILADALEDAGCDAQALLAHCRADGPHASGCWAVEAVLAGL